MRGLGGSAEAEFLGWRGLGRRSRAVFGFLTWMLMLIDWSGALLACLWVVQGN